MARTSGSTASETGPKVAQAALRLFAQYGYAAVSMRQIAQDVGVQAGALYNYVPDKQTLLFGLLRDHMTDLLAARKLCIQSDDPGQALLTFVTFHIDFHLARPEAVFLSYMELRNLTAENFAVIEGLRKSYERELEAIIAAGCDQGYFDVRDAKIAAFAVIGMLKELQTWYRAEGRLDAKEIHELYWEMIAKMVGMARSA